MAGTGKKWLIGCGVGCASSVVLIVLISVGGSLFMMRPFDKAVQAQKDLTEIYGTRTEFVPLPGGVTPDRMERFLTVRRAVMASCETFEGVTAKFDAMEDLDNQGEEPEVGEVVKGVGGIMGAVFGMAGEMGKVTQIRNETLQANGMGLGEYTWIYILAYNSWLGKAPNTGLDHGDEGTMSDSDVEVIGQLMANHVTALQDAGREAEARLWQAQIDRLDRVALAIPFADGNLPGELVAVFKPFRGKLEANYCAYMAEFDLDTIQKKGLSYHTN